MSLDYYTKHLLGMALEACDEWFIISTTRDGGWVAEGNGTHLSRTSKHSTRAEALAALLTDLGETVPARPSEERVAILHFMLGVASASADGDPIGTLIDLYAREPLNVIALLDGGES